MWIYFNLTIDRYISVFHPLFTNIFFFLVAIWLCGSTPYFSVGFFAFFVPNDTLAYGIAEYYTAFSSHSNHFSILILLTLLSICFIASVGRFCERWGFFSARLFCLALLIQQCSLSITSIKFRIYNTHAFFLWLYVFLLPIFPHGRRTIIIHLCVMYVVWYTVCCVLLFFVLMCAL